MSVEAAAHTIIADRLRQAGEQVYSRGHADHPPFKSAGMAADHLLRLVPSAVPLLVMRDRSLRVLRERVLELDRVLVIPNRLGTDVVSIPRNTLFAEDGSRTATALRIDPLPRGSRSYNGPVGLTVVGCLAYDRLYKRLCSFDADRTASILSDILDGLASGFRPPSDMPIVALAHDLQQVEGWPSSAFGFVEADVVITPSRAVVLGSGNARSLQATQASKRSTHV